MPVTVALLGLLAVQDGCSGGGEQDTTAAPAPSNVGLDPPEVLASLKADADASSPAVLPTRDTAETADVAAESEAAALPVPPAPPPLPPPPLEPPSPPPPPEKPGATYPLFLPDPHASTKLVVQQAGLDFLAGIEGKVAIIAAIGPYRTGKSYLLNSLMGFTKT